MMNATLQDFVDHARSKLNIDIDSDWNLDRKDLARNAIKTLRNFLNSKLFNFSMVRPGSALGFMYDSLMQFDEDDEMWIEEDFEDFIDTIHDILDDVEETNDEDVDFEMKSNVSPSLLMFFVRIDGFRMAAIPEDPERPVIQDLFKNLTLRKFAEAVKSQLRVLDSCQGPARRTIATSTFKSVKSYVEDAYSTGLFDEDSAITSLWKAMASISHEEEALDDVMLQEEDVCDFIDIMKEYLDEIEFDFVHDNDCSDMPVNMSANLKRLFDFDCSSSLSPATTSSTVTSDWKPPAFHGLGNSPRLISRIV